MESLGGDRLWVDRFMAQHAAILYYWLLVAIFFFSPALAYNFSELIEAHAVDTYGGARGAGTGRAARSGRGRRCAPLLAPLAQPLAAHRARRDPPLAHHVAPPPPPAGEFVDANEELLKSLPPPLVAAEYYSGAGSGARAQRSAGGGGEGGGAHHPHAPPREPQLIRPRPAPPDMYLFDAFQTSLRDVPRRPPVVSLYDVFSNIRDDEGEHVKTMLACQARRAARSLAPAACPPLVHG